MSTQVHETAVNVANKLTVVGSGGSVISWAAQSDLGWLIGILIGLAGLLISWYYRRKNDRRAEIAHQLYVNRLLAKCHTDSEPPYHDEDGVVRSQEQDMRY